MENCAYTFESWVQVLEKHTKTKESLRFRAGQQPLLFDAFSRPARKNTTTRIFYGKALLLISLSGQSVRSKRGKQERARSKRGKQERARSKRERKTKPLLF